MNGILYHLAFFFFDLFVVFSSAKKKIKRLLPLQLCILFMFLRLIFFFRLGFGAHLPRIRLDEFTKRISLAIRKILKSSLCVYIRVRIVPSLLTSLSIQCNTPIEFTFIFTRFDDVERANSIWCCAGACIWSCTLAICLELAFAGATQRSAATAIYFIFFFKGKYNWKWSLCAVVRQLKSICEGEREKIGFDRLTTSLS